MSKDKKKQKAKEKPVEKKKEKELSEEELDKVAGGTGSEVSAAGAELVADVTGSPTVRTNIRAGVGRIMKD